MERMNEILPDKWKKEKLPSFEVIDLHKGTSAALILCQNYPENVKPSSIIFVEMLIFLLFSVDKTAAEEITEQNGQEARTKRGGNDDNVSRLARRSDQLGNSVEKKERKRGESVEKKAGKEQKNA